MSTRVVNGIKHAIKVEQRNALSFHFNALGRLVGDLKRDDADSLYFGGKHNHDLGSHRLWMRD